MTEQLLIKPYVNLLLIQRTHTPWQFPQRQPCSRGTHAEGAFLHFSKLCFSACPHWPKLRILHSHRTPIQMTRTRGSYQQWHSGMSHSPNIIVPKIQAQLPMYLSTSTHPSRQQRMTQALGSLPSRRWSSWFLTWTWCSPTGYLRSELVDAY